MLGVCCVGHAEHSPVPGYSKCPLFPRSPRVTRYCSLLTATYLLAPGTASRGRRVRAYLVTRRATRRVKPQTCSLGPWCLVLDASGVAARRRDGAVSTAHPISVSIQCMDRARAQRSAPMARRAGVCRVVLPAEGCVMSSAIASTRLTSPLSCYSGRAGRELVVHSK